MHPIGKLILTAAKVLPDGSMYLSNSAFRLLCDTYGEYAVRLRMVLLRVI
jgi:hypothetical protein